MRIRAKFSRVRTISTLSITKAMERVPLRFIFKKVGKNDTTFMEEASHERLVDLPFMSGEASGTVIDGNVVCGVAMINLNGIQHNAPKGVLPWGEPVKDLREKKDES
ncbi:hypothetical protein Tco_1123363 [Tanacetum coccineum]|uniref:Uncharacterized protein n=1 Tax=Tanacetum coccineum TaxID=301880 RepID=A0ABQ5J630_9ASTR